MNANVKSTGPKKTRKQATWHKKVGKIHKALYTRSGGWIGANLGGIPMLLLTTTGRKSGVRRQLPLAYVPDGDNFLIVASNAGGDTTPAWCWNLRSQPLCEVQVGRRAWQCRAREADEQERARLWPKLQLRVPFYWFYRRKTERKIPIVVLERVREL